MSREFGGHDTYSRRFVELLYMPRDTSQRVESFQHDYFWLGSISIQRSSLNYCEWVQSP